MGQNARQMAFGGMMTAVSVVIMCMGSMIPVNTYLCPVLCILVTRLVMGRCGTRLSWCYYGAVTMLSLLLAPDKEAALVYALLGYYPMVKPRLDGIKPRPVRLVLKLLLFTLGGCGVYGLLLAVLGAQALLAEFEGITAWLLAAMVLMWDLLFLMVDRLLSLRPGRK